MTGDWIVHDEHPFAEVRDSETGEVIFPARRGPFRLIEGGKPTTANAVGMSEANAQNTTANSEGGWT